jgi:hypothetical protein
MVADTRNQLMSFVRLPEKHGTPDGQAENFRVRNSSLSGVVNRAKSLRGGYLSGSTVIHLARGLNLLDVCFCPTADAFDQPT